MRNRHRSKAHRIYKQATYGRRRRQQITRREFRFARVFEWYSRGAFAVRRCEKKRINRIANELSCVRVRHRYNRKSGLKCEQRMNFAIARALWPTRASLFACQQSNSIEQYDYRSTCNNRHRRRMNQTNADYPSLTVESKQSIYTCLRCVLWVSCRHVTAELKSNKTNENTHNFQAIKFYAK